MKYTNAEVSLTVKTEGCIALRGNYQAAQKVDNDGKKIISIERDSITREQIKTPAIQLKTIQLPKYHDCSSHTILNNQFVRWALSDDSRPKDMSAGYWKRMPDKIKIKFHVDKYVKDLFGKVEYKFTILE